MEAQVKTLQLLKQENKDLKENIFNLSEHKKENEIIILRMENKNLKDAIAHIEKKLLNKDKEHSQQIKNLTKNIFNFEEGSKLHSSKLRLDTDFESVTFICYIYLYI